MRDLTQNVGNVLTIQHQTCVDEIFKCTIFVGYGGVIFFYRCSTLHLQIQVEAFVNTVAGSVATTSFCYND